MWWSTLISPNLGRRTSIALADPVSPLCIDSLTSMRLKEQHIDLLICSQVDSDTWVLPLTWSPTMTALTWRVLKNSWVLRSSLFPAVLTRVYMWPSTTVKVGRRSNCEQERWVQTSSILALLQSYRFSDAFNIFDVCVLWLMLICDFLFSTLYRSPILLP